jgi:hypothetical protein
VAGRGFISQHDLVGDDVFLQPLPYDRGRRKFTADQEFVFRNSHHLAVGENFSLLIKPKSIGRTAGRLPQFIGELPLQERKRILSRGPNKGVWTIFEGAHFSRKL